jgi:hypothetical protein
MVTTGITGVGSALGVGVKLGIAVKVGINVKVGIAVGTSGVVCNTVGVCSTSTVRTGWLMQPLMIINKTKTGNALVLPFITDLQQD